MSQLAAAAVTSALLLQHKYTEKRTKVLVVISKDNFSQHCNQRDTSGRSNFRLYTAASLVLFK